MVSALTVADFNEKGVITILLNNPNTGLAETTDSGKTFTINVNDDAGAIAVQDCAPGRKVCYAGKPGVYEAKINLAAADFDRKNLNVDVSVDLGGSLYSDSETSALVLVKERKALPETDLIAIAAFAVLALFALNRSRKHGN